MYTRALGLATSALIILAYGTIGAMAQDQMTPQPKQQQTESQPMGQEGVGTIGQGGAAQGGMQEGTNGGGMVGQRGMPVGA